uniref:Uncharacterized protein n=1 Tax=Rhodnius prolixus TaxID=13249 RepID=T1IA99_RHOPR
MKSFTYACGLFTSIAIAGSHCLKVIYCWLDGTHLHSVQQKTMYIQKRLEDRTSNCPRNNYIKHTKAHHLWGPDNDPDNGEIGDTTLAERALKTYKSKPLFEELSITQNVNYKLSALKKECLLFGVGWGEDSLFVLMRLETDVPPPFSRSDDVSELDPPPLS